MKRIGWMFGWVAVAGVGVILFSGGASAAEKKVTLKLGGQYCNFYPDDVENALKAVPGVDSVRFNGDKTMVVVSGKDSTMKTASLISSVNGVKGSTWYCSAEVAK